MMGQHIKKKKNTFWSRTVFLIEITVKTIFKNLIKKNQVENHISILTSIFFFLFVISKIENPKTMTKLIVLFYVYTR